MNKWIGIGRLTDAPKMTSTTGDKATTIARFTVAIDRKFDRENADFISCVAFGKTAEFVEKYFSKGSKIVVEGRIQTGSYTNKDGQKVYTTDIVCEGVEFGDSKKNEQGSSVDTSFMSIPEGIDEDLPFN